ncbi:hypothetical protein F511_35621 [Dorcoceras hygrometricum]|uniref:Uncharacterized protein n=1 Tax=Dorcoceras hygrometricum TaxID=472368 RepID=A0A2Z7ARZ7_9LAMI|nr:hypothetical protein F511_35621 [Dorcoceras hygrometricum]
MAGALPAGPPTGSAGHNRTDLGSNRGLTMENGSLKVGAPAMRHDAPLSTSTSLSGSLDHLDHPQTTMSPLGTSRTEPSPLEIAMTEASSEGRETCQKP